MGSKRAMQIAESLGAACTGEDDELALIVALHEGAPQWAGVERSFMRIVKAWYDADAVSEEAVLRWWEEATASSGGGEEMLEQMRPFVQWLTEAEEESDESRMKSDGMADAYI